MAIMKNVSMNMTTIHPYPNNSGFPAPPVQAPSVIPKSDNPVIVVSFSAQFDSEFKAMEFATVMLTNLKHYGD